MLLSREQKTELGSFLESIRLSDVSKDRESKIEQILAYLEIVHAGVRRLSRRRRLVFVDSGAGNCYLSFLLNYFYSRIDRREIEFHCIDRNERLMQNCAARAESLGYRNMRFHGCSIVRFDAVPTADIVYTLHACDTATDEALHLGVRLRARTILSVSCCQHSLKKQLKGHPLTGITRHRLFKDKLVHMLADSLRALLLESLGYEADIIEFVSSRYTDKNVMIRARRAGPRDAAQVRADYEQMKAEFRLRPALEDFLEASSPGRSA